MESTPKRIPWNKGLKGVQKVSEETRRKMSIAHKGQKGSRHFLGKTHTPEAREKIRQSKLGNKNHRYGKEVALETRKKLSESQKGEKNHQWRGGITQENRKVRRGFEYKLWREAVFLRDNWTCVFCGMRGCVLNADHIKPFALFPELRFAIDNGRTLCVPCHRLTPTFGFNQKKNGLHVT